MNLKALLLIFISVIFIATTRTEAQGWLWAKSAGGVGNENAAAVTSDTAGNLYVAGTFSSATVTFGGVTLTNNNAGYRDIFVVKYNSSGSVIWARSAGGSDDDFATCISLDAAGNIFVGGYFYSATLSAGTTTLNNDTVNVPSTSDLFVIKYDTAGNVAWAQSAGGTLDDQLNGIKADAAGDVIVAGSFESKFLVFGSDTVKNQVATTDEVFIIKYTGAGAFSWATGSGGGGYDYGYAVATDAANNIFVAGKFNSSTIHFGATTLTNSVAASDDAFLVKYNASGVAQWATSPVGAGNDFATALGTDASGNVYMAGNFASASLNFGGSNILTNAGAYDIFVAKYNTGGTLAWAKSNGGTLDDYVNTLSIDDTDNVIVAGNFGSPHLVFGGSAVNNDSAGTYNLYIAKYNTAGTALWANTSGGPTSNANGVTTDASGNIYLAGDYSDSDFVFGEHVLVNASSTTNTFDMFLAKYSPQPLPTATPLVSATTNTIILYPNPACNELNVGMKQGGYNTISVYDCLGRLVYQNELTGSETMVTINTAGLADGIYYLRAAHGEALENATFVIRK